MKTQKETKWVCIHLACSCRPRAIWGSPALEYTSQVGRSRVYKCFSYIRELIVDGNVRLFLLLILMTFWSESSSSFLRGLRTRPSRLSIRMTSYYVRDLYGCWFQASTQFLLLLVCCQLNQNLDMMLLSDYANPCECLKSFSEHLQPLCCPSHPRSLNSLMHLQIFPTCSRCCFGLD